MLSAEPWGKLTLMRRKRIILRISGAAVAFFPEKNLSGVQKTLYSMETEYFFAESGCATFIFESCFQILHIFCRIFFTGKSIPVQGVSDEAKKTLPDRFPRTVPLNRVLPGKFEAVPSDGFFAAAFWNISGGRPEFA